MIQQSNMKAILFQNSFNLNKYRMANNLDDDSSADEVFCYLFIYYIL